MMLPAERHIASDVHLLPVDHPDRLPALRLIVGQEERSADQSSAYLQGFLGAVRAQQLMVDPIVAVHRNGRIDAAIACVQTPGRSAMLLHGPAVGDRFAQLGGGRLIESACAAMNNRDVVLAQSLIHPECNETARTYRDAGFQYLAELAYLERGVDRKEGRSTRARHLSYITYAPDVHHLFIDALNRTYVGSHDCPGLTGLRATDDVLTGHRHSGIGDPSQMWFLAVDRGDTQGVLLLNRVFNRSALEVVYMGVVPEARGRGVGDALLQLALHVAQLQGVSSLTLAVDGSNLHACRLYGRCGFVETGKRRAWIKRRPF